MKFSRPENYDPLEKGEGWTLYVGENDWEGAWTWAWVDIPTLATMIWVELEYPEELRGWVFGEPSPDDGEAKKAKAWSKAGVDLWLAGAKRYMRSGSSAAEAFEDVLDKTAMKQYVRSHGKKSLLDKKAAAAAPTTGPEALLGALQRLDLDAHEKRQRDILKKGLVSKRDGAIQSLNAITGLRRNNLQPSDLMISRVPVIPAAFRPFTVIGNSFSPGDANELYRDLFKVRDAARASKKLIGERPEDRLALYDSVKALYGYGEPVQPKTAKRGVSGFMQKISGSSPKYSFLQRKLLSKTQDSVARGVITVNPNLGLDEIGVPHDMAARMYAPHVQARLVRAGRTPAEAVLAIRDKHPDAKIALEREMKERPVIYSRSPAWHKFNIIAGWPKLIDGDAIHISPLVTSGAGADFDGDQMNLHVPAMKDAVTDAREKLMPSKMLFSDREMGKVVPLPKHEAILGLWSANRDPAKKTHQFDDEPSALAAIRSGKVRLSDEVTIGKSIGKSV